jgi:hypothetical protein
MKVLTNDEKNIRIVFNLFDRDLISDLEPNVPIRNWEGKVNHELVAKLQTEVYDRIKTKLDEFVEVFEDGCLLDLILISGGSRRTLFDIIQLAVQYTESLPVANAAVRKVRGIIRNILYNSVDEKNWNLLAKVFLDPLYPYSQLPEYHSLIKGKCILKYQESNTEWYRVNHLLVEKTRFQQALDEVRQST